MTTSQKILNIVSGALLLILVIFAVYSARPSTQPSLGSGSLYIPAYIATSSATQATTTLYAFSGVLHTISITKPVSNSVISIYDSATSTNPTGPIVSVTIPTSPTSTPFTLLIDGNFANGLTIAQSGATSTVTLTYQQQ